MKLLPVHKEHLRKTKRLTGSVEKRKRECGVGGGESDGSAPLLAALRNLRVFVFRLCRLSASLLQLQDTRTMHTKKNKIVIKKEAKVGDSVSVPE